MAGKPAIIVILLAALGAAGLFALPGIGGSSPEPPAPIEVGGDRDRADDREARQKKDRR